MSPLLLAKFDRWFERTVAGREKYCAKLPICELAKVGKRDPKKRRIAKNFPQRLMKRKKETAVLVYDLSVPFTNNEAERNVRMIMVKENISGCLRTLEGAEDHMALSSVAIRQHEGQDMRRTFTNVRGTSRIVTGIRFDGRSRRSEHAQARFLMSEPLS